MKELVIGFVSFLLNTLVVVLGFCKGPIVIGILAGTFILSFTSGAEASVVGEVTASALSFSEKFAILTGVFGAVLTLFSFLSETIRKSVKTAFQANLDAAIKASKNK